MSYNYLSRLSRNNIAVLCECIQENAVVFANEQLWMYHIYKPWVYHDEFADTHTISAKNRQEALFKICNIELENLIRAQHLNINEVGFINFMSYCMKEIPHVFDTNCAQCKRWKESFTFDPVSGNLAISYLSQIWLCKEHLLNEFCDWLRNTNKELKNVFPAFQKFVKNCQREVEGRVIYAFRLKKIKIHY